MSYNTASNAALNKLLAKAFKAKTAEAQVKSYAWLAVHIMSCETNGYCHDSNVIDRIILGFMDGYQTDEDFYAFHNELIAHVFNNHCDDEQYYVSN